MKKKYRPHKSKIEQAIAKAHSTGVPTSIIWWRIEHGWPVNKLHVKTLAGLNE